MKLSVQHNENADEKYLQLEKFLREQGTAQTRLKNGIIYAGSRRETEEIAAFLQRRGFRADFYHAGLEPQERKRVQEAFFDNSENGLDIVVATNAFGMGIDKPDIRYIVHWTFPGTLEAYCQEFGRAGRDGEDARCVYCSSVKRIADCTSGLLERVHRISNFCLNS